MIELHTLLQANDRHGAIRPMEYDDIAWAVGLAQRTYPFDIDTENAEQFGRYAIDNPEMLLLRGDRTVGCVSANRWVMDTKIIFAHEMFVFAEKGNDWEPYFLVKSMVQWSRAVGAKSYCTSSFTGAPSVTEAFARRLGAVREKPYYEIQLGILH